MSMSEIIQNYYRRGFRLIHEAEYDYVDEGWGGYGVEVVMQRLGALVCIREPLQGYVIVEEDYA